MAFREEQRMSLFKKILYVASNINEDQDHPLDEALSVAQKNDATLSILVLKPNLSRSVSVNDSFEEAAKERIHASLEKDALSLGIDIAAMRDKIEIIFEDKKPFVIEIVKRIMRDGYDLVIKEAEDFDKAASFFTFQSNDINLLRKSPVPVWMSHRTKVINSEPLITVAIHPEEENPEAEALNKKLLNHADKIANMMGAKLKIITCWSLQYEDHLRHAPFVKVPEEEVDATVDQERQRSLNEVNRMIQESNMSCEYEIVHEKGRPQKIIPAFIKDNKVTLMVMGTVSRTGIPGFIMGNTAEDIIHQIDISMLAIKPDGFKSPVEV